MVRLPEQFKNFVLKYIYLTYSGQNLLFFFNIFNARENLFHPKLK